MSCWAGTAMTRWSCEIQTNWTSRRHSTSLYSKKTHCQNSPVPRRAVENPLLMEVPTVPTLNPPIGMDWRAPWQRPLLPQALRSTVACPSLCPWFLLHSSSLPQMKMPPMCKSCVPGARRLGSNATLSAWAAS